MVTEITGLPLGVIGFRFSGEVTKDDYDKVIFPIVKDKAYGQEYLRMILILDTPPSNFTPAAWMSDALLAMQYITKWEKVAAVSDSEFMKMAVPVLDKLVPGESRLFSHAEEEQAMEWVKAGSASLR